jgi:hypothetical protein
VEVAEAENQGQAMTVGDEKHTAWFRESPNSRQAVDEASLRELRECMLTYGQLEDLIATEDGTVMHLRRLQGQMEGLPFAKSGDV